MTQQVVGTHILKHDENGISGVRLCADSTMITSPIWYTQMVTQMAYVYLHSPPKNYPNVTVNRPVPWIPYGKNHHQIQAQFPRRSCRVCVCARYHRIRPWRQPWSKLHKKHQPLGNARKLWLAMVGGSDTPWLPRIWIWWRWQFWFVFIFRKSSFFEI